MWGKNGDLINLVNQSLYLHISVKYVYLIFGGWLDGFLFGDAAELLDFRQQLPTQASSSGR